jgi:hypothetical protein
MEKPRGANTVSIGLVLVVVLSLTAACEAGTLVWNASPGDVAGYKVYFSTKPNDQPDFRDVGNTTRLDLDSLPLIEGKPYYLCVSAYNEAGESPPCKPVVFIPGDNTPPSPPEGLTTQ